MMRQKFVRIIQSVTATLLLGCTSAYAQGLQAPSENHVAVSKNLSNQAALVSPKNRTPTSIQPAGKKKIAIVIYPDFETLDVFGPVQMWGRLDDHELVMVSQHGGLVKSAQGFEAVADYSFDNAPQFDIIMVPGSLAGTEREVKNPAMLEFLRRQDRGTELTTSVCTGSALLARAGILDGRKATSNKRRWEFATSQGSMVHWQGRARWVVDGKFITSSGVSAGTDMALALVEMLYGRARAERVAAGAEYTWNDDPSNDPFAVE
ncbi:DJ-1/PfpI family protein [Pinirhizobacter sp.]|uniref:DJ-1/PfpI family protein n=1 Tax=Pinirhizobacter sp. TaxID=2950432 RepID=UPI002F3E8F16